MIHIVFQAQDVQVLQAAIEMDETLAGEIVQIADDFAVGPLVNIYEPEGYDQRREWWKELLQHSPYMSSLETVNDRLAVEGLLQKLNENEEEVLWIWMGQNHHDVCGYYWLMSQLKEYAGRIHVLYLNNLPFINEKGGIFYPSVLHEIQPKEFLKAKKLERLITLSEFEVDPDEWKKICEENAMVRTLEGGKKIAGKDVSFYDKDILGAITSESQKLQKVLNHLFGKLKVQTGDVFIVWRMRKLAEEGRLEIQGDWNKGWKEIEIKKPSFNDSFIAEETGEK